MSPVEAESRIHSSQHVGLMLDFAGFAAVAILVMLNLTRFDLNWDQVDYHLPFAAFRAGLMRHSAFEMRDIMEARFRGYPPLADWLQGWLWRLTRRPEATQLVSPIAIAVLAAYARWAFGIRALWTVAIFAAIPITLTALNSANLDVWTNAFFCVYLLAAFKVVRDPAPGWVAHALAGSAALAVCANSKLQFAVLAAAALAIQTAATLLLAWLDRPELHHSRLRRVRLRSVALAAVLAPIVMATPIRNAIRFGNPVYPFTVQAFGISLPGTQVNVWTGPRRLADVGRAERYALSQLDFDAINARFAGFDQDQGGQPEGADGNRMGGALSVLLVGSAGVLVLALRRRRWTLPDWVMLAAAACLLAAVVAFPGSNELRYFCFVNIMASLAAIAVTEAGIRSGEAYLGGLRAGLRLLLLGSVLFTNFATGLRQLGTVDRRTLKGILADQGFDALLVAALRQSDTVCYIRQDSDAFFLSPLLNRNGRGHSYRILVRYTTEDCPAGSAIVR